MHGAPFDTGAPVADGAPPLVFTPRRGRAGPDALGAAIDSWRPEFEACLLSHGAVLFRGFEIRTPEAFERFAGQVAPTFTDYKGGKGTRPHVVGNVYKSTLARRFVPIPLHCEMSYLRRFPRKVFFYCHVAPDRGGQTPIADMAAAWCRIDPAVREAFVEKGVRLTHVAPRTGRRKTVRNWPEMLGAEDRDGAEAACREVGLEWTWLPDGAVRLTSLSPAAQEHPETGTPVWFNHAHMLHDSWSWEFRRLRRRLLAGVLAAGERRRRRRGTWRRLPCHATFGDGEEIPPEAMCHVREVLWDHAVLFDWQPGDVLVLDNARMAHGRMPFGGRREVYVTMHDLIESSAASPSSP